MEETGEKIRGLTTEEVEKRLAEGQGNEIQNESSRSVKDIVLSNVFTLFNLINVILFVMVFTVFSWKNMAFMGVAFFNTIIGIIQELRAKKILDELRILTASETDAVRDGRQAFTSPVDVMRMRLQLPQNLPCIALISPMLPANPGIR